MARATEIVARVTAMRTYLEVDKTDHFSHTEMQRLMLYTEMLSIYFRSKSPLYHDTQS